MSKDPEVGMLEAILEGVNVASIFLVGVSGGDELQIKIGG